MQIIEHDFKVLKIKGQKFELHFRTRIYNQCPTQDKAQVWRLIRSGASLKQKDSVYYILAETNVVPLEEKERVIQEFTEKYELDANHLDVLTSYYLGGLEGDDILDLHKMREIKKYEVGEETIKQNIKKDWVPQCNKMFKIFASKSKPQNEEWWFWEKRWVTPTGHGNFKKGLIDAAKPYEWKWALLDTEDEFEFSGKTYKATASVYKVGAKGQMDKVLCLEQNGKTYFFDENIERMAGDSIREKRNGIQRDN